MTVGGLEQSDPDARADGLAEPRQGGQDLLGPVDVQDIVAAAEHPRGREVPNLQFQAGEMGVEQPGVGIPRAVAHAGPGQHPRECTNLAGRHRRPRGGRLGQSPVSRRGW